MATLLIGVAINIGASILLNKFFGPEGQDIVQEGPRLSDLSVSSAAYGQMRQIGYGSFRMGGNMIWSPGIREVVREVEQESPSKGGGGGGSVTARTFEYRASFAVGFGEGPATEIVRIWADSKLIYDASSAGTGIGKYRFRFHPGNETQLPDPLIEADVGVGQAPAYRGEAYLVANDWPLVDFSNRIPNLSAEIAFQATEQKLVTVLTPTNLPDLPGTGIVGASQSARLPEDDLMVFWAQDDLQVVQGSSFTQLSFFDVFVSGSTAFERTVGVDGAFYRWTTSDTSYRKFDIFTNAEIYTFPTDVDESARIATQVLNLPGIGRRVLQWVTSDDFTKFGLYTFMENADGNSTQEIARNRDFTELVNFVQDYHSKTRLWVLQESTTQTVIYELSAIPVVGLLGSLSVEPVLTRLGTVTKNGGNIAGTQNAGGWVWLPIENAIILSYGDSGLVKFDIDTRSVTHTNVDVNFETRNQYTLGPQFAWGQSGSDFITISTEDLSVIAREPISGFFTGSNASRLNSSQSLYEWETNSVSMNRFDFGVTPPSDLQMAKVFLNRTTSQGEDLSSIVSDICQRGGLDTADIDVTDLVGINVDGFVVNRQTAVKEALRPLTRAFLFDAVESDFLIKFVRRGKNLVLASPIPADDIGLSQGTDDEPFREIRTQESELPERVTVVYADKTQDYQQASQSDKRQREPTPTIRTRNELTLELPLAMDANTGRRVAQRQLFIAWAERRSFETQLPWTYLALDPTDSVEMVLDTETARVRFSEIEIGADLTLAVQAVLEDADADTSVIPGDSGSFVVQVVPDLRPTKFFALNLPLLRDRDASQREFVRAYFAMSGFSAQWPGAVLFRSRDDGASYQEVVSQSVGVSWGIVTGTAIPDPASTNTWNRDQQFNIRVLNGLAGFQTATDIEVLNGANLLAVIKRDNTIELIQFRDVTPVDDTQITVSQLLRARRGTEVESTGHTVGETVVLLTTAAVNSFRLDLAARNVLQQFRSVTLGTLIEDASDAFVTYTGRDLKPYSVAQLAVSIASNQDTTISWKRRTRFAGELRDGTGEVPLNEANRSYQIDVVNVATGAVVDTKTTSTDSFLYTKAAQDADGTGPASPLVIQNPNAENGVVGWTNEVGTLVQRSSQPGPFEGSFSFSSADVAVTRAYQDLHVPADSHGFIDATIADIHFAWRQNSLEGFDFGRILVEFYDSTMTIIGSRFTGAQTRPNGWTLREQNLNIPVNTRTIRFFIEMTRDAGLNNNASFDALEATIRHQGGNTNFRFDVFQISDVVGRGSVASIPFG